MVDEIVRHHVAQHDLEPEDPAALFGQAVESDRVKRAREDVTIAELDGQLKRRRIESIQFCLEAMETVGGVDDRDRLRCTDMIRTVAFGASSSSTEQAEDPEVCIRQIVNQAGRAKESPSIDIKVGRIAKKFLLDEHPSYIFPKKIYCNGQMVSANCWLASQRQYLERALATL